MIDTVKTLLFFLLLFSLFGCPSYDPPNPGPTHIYNCSDKAVYVYYSNNGKLEAEPRLELFVKKEDEFIFKNIGCNNLLKSPDYRVNAYEEKEVKNPYLKSKDFIPDSVYVFFITEEIMKKTSWNEIVNKQQYEKKIALTMEDYNDLHRLVTFSPTN